MKTSAKHNLLKITKHLPFLEDHGYFFKKRKNTSRTLWNWTSERSWPCASLNGVVTSKSFACILENYFIFFVTRKANERNSYVPNLKTAHDCASDVRTAGINSRCRSFHVPQIDLVIWDTTVLSIIVKIDVILRHASSKHHRYVSCYIITCKTCWFGIRVYLFFFACESDLAIVKFL